MLKKIIKKAYKNPHLRSELLPIIKLAMEFPTEEALKQYLKDHPNADPKNHSVEKSEKKDSQSPVKESKDGIHISLGNIDPKEFKEAMSKSFDSKIGEIKKTLSKTNDFDLAVIKKKSEKTMKELNDMPFGKKVSQEMKQALSVHKKTQTTKLLTKVANGLIVALAVTGNKGFATETLTAAAEMGAIYVANKITEKKLDYLAKEEGWKADDNFSSLSYDIIRNKVTPKDINKKYESKADEIAKKMKSNEIDAFEALNELDNLEKEYKKDALPHIEKALDSIGFEKDDQGNYKSKEEEEYAKSLLKVAAESDNIMLAIVLDELRTELKNQILMQEIFNDKDSIITEMQNVMTGKTAIPKPEFEQLNKQQRYMKKFKS